MKIKNLLLAPKILQKAKELNIDLSTLDPNTRVKIKDGCLHFEGEKECFVSAKNENEPEHYYLQWGDIIQEGDEYYCKRSSAWFETSRFGCALDWDIKYRRKITKPIEEYYYFDKWEQFITKEGDEYLYLNKWASFTEFGVVMTPTLANVFRRKIQKNTIPEDGC